MYHFLYCPHLLCQAESRVCYYAPQQEGAGGLPTAQAPHLTRSSIASERSPPGPHLIQLPYQTSKNMQQLSAISILQGQCWSSTILSAATLCSGPMIHTLCWCTPRPAQSQGWLHNTAAAPARHAPVKRTLAASSPAAAAMPAPPAARTSAYHRPLKHPFVRCLPT